MKKILFFAVLVIMMTGCAQGGKRKTSRGNVVEQDIEIYSELKSEIKIGSNPEEVKVDVNKDETLEIANIDEKENFEGEYLKKLPDVKNIINYLGIDKENVLVLTEKPNNLVFCFYEDDDIAIKDELVLSHYDYIRELEADGYELTQRDGTIIGSFELVNDKYEISIINLGKYVEENKKDRNEWKKIENQNKVFEIKLISN